MLIEYLQTSNSRKKDIDDIVKKLRSKYNINGMPTRDQLRRVAIESGITEVYHTPAAIGLDGANIIISKETGNKYIVTLPFKSRGLTEFFTSHELGHEILDHKSIKPEYEREANYFAKLLTNMHPTRAVAQAMPEIVLILFYDMPKFLLNKKEKKILRNL